MGPIVDICTKIRVGWLTNSVDFQIPSLPREDWRTLLLRDGWSGWTVAAVTIRLKRADVSNQQLPCAGGSDRAAKAAAGRQQGACR